MLTCGERLTMTRHRQHTGTYEVVEVNLQMAHGASPLWSQCALVLVGQQSLGARLARLGAGTVDDLLAKVAEEVVEDLVPSQPESGYNGFAVPALPVDGIMGGEPSPQVVCSDSVGEQVGFPGSCEHGDDADHYLQIGATEGLLAKSGVKMHVVPWFEVCPPPLPRARLRPHTNAIRRRNHRPPQHISQIPRNSPVVTSLESVSMATLSPKSPCVLVHALVLDAVRRVGVLRLLRPAGQTTDPSSERMPRLPGTSLGRRTSRRAG